MNKELLIAYGFGDGGGGVNRDMLENRRRIDKIPGLPNLKTSTAAEYFRDLQETVKNTDQYVHTWDGELYLEYHRGTYTSQAYNKRMNRKMELLYRNTEWLTVMNALKMGGLTYARQEELTKGWKHILTDQFHDIIPVLLFMRYMKIPEKIMNISSLWHKVCRKMLCPILSRIKRTAIRYLMPPDGREAKL